MSVDWKEVIAAGVWKKNFDGEMEFHLPLEFHEELKNLPHNEKRLVIIDAGKHIVDTKRWYIRNGRLITGLREISLDVEAVRVIQSGGSYTFGNGWVMDVA